jgi:heme exporter protein A
MWKVVGQNLTQTFNQRSIFNDISFDVQSGESLVLTGPNGSGKTTLIRIICHLLRPISGHVDFLLTNQKKEAKDLYSIIGLVGPYLQLYNNLTALENYSFFAKIRGFDIDINLFKSLMKKMGLAGRELDELRTYSSGMLQRMKYVCALLHQPEILVLDEPTANLDERGCEIVYQIIQEQKNKKILIMATNEPGEIKFGDKKIQLSA